MMSVAIGWIWAICRGYKESEDQTYRQGAGRFVRPLQTS